MPDGSAPGPLSGRSGAASAAGGDGLRVGERLPFRENLSGDIGPMAAGGTGPGLAPRDPPCALRPAPLWGTGAPEIAFWARRVLKTGDGGGSGHICQRLPNGSRAGNDAAGWLLLAGLGGSGGCGLWRVRPRGRWGEGREKGTVPRAAPPPLPCLGTVRLGGLGRLGGGFKKIEQMYAQGLWPPALFPHSKKSPDPGAVQASAAPPLCAPRVRRTRVGTVMGGGYAHRHPPAPCGCVRAGTAIGKGTHIVPTLGVRLHARVGTPYSGCHVRARPPSVGNPNTAGVCLQVTHARVGTAIGGCHARARVGTAWGSPKSGYPSRSRARWCPRAARDSIAIR